MIDQELLDILACPKCRADVKLEGILAAHLPAPGPAAACLTAHVAHTGADSAPQLQPML